MTWLYGHRMVKSILVFSLVIMWLTGSCSSLFTTTAQHHKGVLCIVSLGKGQNSKFEVWFLLNAYGFITIIKLKNCILNHDKSRTICKCTWYWPRLKAGSHYLSINSMTMNLSKMATNVCGASCTAA